MEKINKEELMKKLNLTDEELEKITGGVNFQCFNDCIMNHGADPSSEVPLIVQCFEKC